MMEIRRAEDRGQADHGWLRTSHTFSFADYYDPKHMGFRALRVINDDWVDPGEGFPTHPHRDMEIVTYVLEGALQHRDSMGTGSVIRPHDVQRMTAGSGVTHSEFNASEEELVHLLQIWILPESKGLAPSYEQRTFPVSEKRGRLRLVASHDGAEGSVRIHQDARIFAGLFDEGEKATLELLPKRHAWVQVARGEIDVNGKQLHEGDGAAISEEGAVRIAGVRDSEVLVFDLA